MKKVFATMLSVLMLLTFLPLASPPARAGAGTRTTPSVFSSVYSTETAYVGETIYWAIDYDGSGPYQYALDVWKDGQPFSVEGWYSGCSRHYKFLSPGRYKALGKVRITGGNEVFSEFSEEITVKTSVNRITKVEPLGPTSLRITWNKVPGAIKYYLYRSTDMKNWTLVKETTATSFANTYLKAGTRYIYRVRYHRLGLSWCDLSPAAAGVPMAKTRITSLTSPSKGRVRLAWAKAAGASGYQVAMASSANGSYKPVRQLNGTVAIFSGVRSGSTLFFKVRPYRRIYSTTYWGQYTAPRAVKVK